MENDRPPSTRDMLIGMVKGAIPILVFFLVLIGGLGVASMTFAYPKRVAAVCIFIIAYFGGWFFYSWRKRGRTREPAPDR